MRVSTLILALALILAAGAVYAQTTDTDMGSTAPPSPEMQVPTVPGPPSAETTTPAVPPTGMVAPAAPGAGPEACCPPPVSAYGRGWTANQYGNVVLTEADARRLACEGYPCEDIAIANNIAIETGASVREVLAWTDRGLTWLQISMYYGVDYNQVKNISGYPFIGIGGTCGMGAGPAPCPPPCPTPCPTPCPNPCEQPATICNPPVGAGPATPPAPPAEPAPTTPSTY